MHKMSVIILVDLVFSSIVPIVNKTRVIFVAMKTVDYVWGEMSGKASAAFMHV